MKKTFILCAVSAFAMLVACNKEQTEPSAKESLKLDKTTVAIKSADAGTFEILLSSANVTPAATSDAEWLTVDEITARVLKFSYTANESEAERTGIITVTAGSLNAVKVTVTQAGKKDIDPSMALTLGALTEDGKGVIYYVDPDDPSTGMAISIDCISGVDPSVCVWSPLDAVAGAESRVNGAANQELLLAGVSDPASAYPAAYWCSQVGEGWYLPALDEMLKVREIYAADVTSFDNWLTSNGGSVLNVGKGSYWTSTEGSSSEAWFVKVTSTKDPETISKTSSTRSVRAVKVIGNLVRPAEPVVITLSKSSLTLEGAACNEEVGVEVKNGTLSSVEVNAEDASWLSASISDSKISISATANDGEDRRSATITVSAAGEDGAEPVTATISVEQKPQPKADGFKLLDTYSEGGKVVGVVFWVSDDGMSAKIVSLTRSEKIAWAVAESSAATTLIEAAVDKADGSVNTAAIREFVKDSPADVPALAYLDALGEGWYWPAINELQSLFEAYNGTGYDAATNAKPNGLTEDEKAARAAFDALLTDNGGVKLNEADDNNNGEQYLASTQVDGTQVYSFRFGKRNINNDTGKTGTTRMVRAVKLVSK